MAAVISVASAAVGLAGCGSGASAGSTAARARRAEVAAHRVTGLGTILVDGAGYTLYAYIPDHRGPSRCIGHCAVEWPPLLLPNGSAKPIAGRGVQRSMLGTARRSSGREQVTYDGWPLYRYKDDGAAGEITGQGETMGLWYVVDTDGSIDRGPVPASLQG